MNRRNLLKLASMSAVIISIAPMALADDLKARLARIKALREELHAYHGQGKDAERDPHYRKVRKSLQEETQALPPNYWSDQRDYIARKAAQAPASSVPGMKAHPQPLPNGAPK